MLLTKTVAAQQAYLKAENMLMQLKSEDLYTELVIPHITRSQWLARKAQEYLHNTPVLLPN